MADSSSNNTAKNDAAVSSVADQLASTKLSADGGGGGGSNSEVLEKNNEEDADDLLLFSPTPAEDCPVCMVPLPINSLDYKYWVCCGRNICFACEVEQGRARNLRNNRRKKEELPPLEEACAFCRVSASKFDNMKVEEKIRCLEERIRKGDAAAAHCLGSCYWTGMHGFEINQAKALENFQRASNLGCGISMRQMAFAYTSGKFGGLQENRVKAKKHAAEAVKKGDAIAHFVLGCYQFEDGNVDLAIRHCCLAAEGGYVEAMKVLWEEFYNGNISKVDLEATLRRHTEACDEMDSEECKRYNAYRDANAGGDDVLKAVFLKYYRGKINAKQLKELIK